MSRVAKVAVDLEANSAKFTAGLGKADRALSSSAAKWDRSLKKVDGGFSSLNRTVSKISFGAVSIGIAGIGAALTGAAVKAAVFGEAMAEVSTLLDDKSGIDGLRASVLKLSAAFGSDAITQAKALYQVISAGASDSKQAIEILTAANKLAKGGVTDVTTAADGLTSALNAYGDEAGTATNVSDAFFTAMKAGKTTVGELSASIGNVAPIAAQAGVSLDELLAATAALTKGGMATTISMNGLRAIVAAIIKPSAEAVTMSKSLGLEFSAAGLKAKGLSGFLADVTQKTGKSTEKMAKLFGGVEALAPVLALSGKAANDFSNILDNMARKAGETEKALATISDTPIESFRKLRAEGENAIIGIGDTLLDKLNPAMNGLIALIKLARWEFGQFDSSEQQLKYIDLEINKISDTLQSLRSDKMPDFLQVGEIDYFETRLQNLRDEYNQVADAVHRANAAAKPPTSPVSASVATSVTPGPAVASKDIDKLQKATADARFELELLIGGYSDAEKEALKFARAQGLLNERLGDVDITPEQLKTYDDYLAALEKLDAKQKQIIENEKKQKTGLEEYADAAQDTMTQIDNATVNAFRSMEDALVDFVRTGKLDFRSLAGSIVNDLIRMQIQQSITGPLSGMLSSAGSSIFGAGASSLFSGFGGTSYATAGTTGAFGPSFAGGGDTGNAPRSGGLDGQGGFMAMLHPQETVVDHTLGGGADSGPSGGTFIIDARGADKQGMAQLQNMIAALNGSIEQRAVAAVVNASKRGGAGRKALA